MPIAPPSVKDEFMVRQQDFGIGLPFPILDYEPPITGPRTARELDIQRESEPVSGRQLWVERRVRARVVLRVDRGELRRKVGQWSGAWGASWHEACHHPKCWIE